MAYSHSRVLGTLTPAPAVLPNPAKMHILAGDASMGQMSKDGACSWGIYTTYRNRDRYTQWLNILEEKSSSNIESKARKQSLYYRDFLSEHFVSQPLLNSYMEDSLRDKKMRPVPLTSTLCACDHNGTNFIVHCSGKYMDDLVITRGTNSDEGLSIAEDFSYLSLGKGQEILNVFQVASTFANSNSESHLVAHTKNELFHLRTAELDSKVMLDPLQKWQFPEEIIATSSSRTSFQGVVLLDSGSINSWNPSDGPIKTHDMNTKTNVFESAIQSLEMSLHPQTCYYGAKGNIKIVDFRSTSTAHLFSAKSVAENSAAVLPDVSVISLSQHSSTSHYLFVGMSATGSKERRNTSSVSLLDIRYPKIFVNQKFCDVQTSLQFSSMGELLPHDSHKNHHNSSMLASDGIMCGYASNSSQLLLHSIQIGQRDSADERDAYSAFLSSSMPFNAQESSVHWALKGFPIVDCASPHVTTKGALLRSCHTGFADADADEKDKDKDFKNKRRRNGDHNNTKRLLLYQQNSIGDVYVQPIHIPGDYNTEETVTARFEKKKQAKCKRFGDHSATIPSSAVFDADIGNSSNFPLPSSVFVPHVDQSNIRGFDVMRLENIGLQETVSIQSGLSISERNSSKTAEILSKKLSPEESKSVLTKSLETILLKLRREPLSLWSISVYILSNEKKNLDLQTLMEFLNDCEDISREDSNASIKYMKAKRTMKVTTAKGSERLAGGKDEKIGSGCHCSYDSIDSEVICSSCSCIRAHDLFYFVKNNIEIIKAQDESNGRLAIGDLMGALET